MSVIVVGSTTIDTIILPKTKTLKIGGVTTYAGFTFQYIGLGTTVLSNIAKEDSYIFDFFAQNNIQFINGDTKTTTKFTNNYSIDKRMQKMPTCASPIQSGYVKPAISAYNIFHFGPLHPKDVEIAMFKLAFRHKKIISLDLQGYVRKIYNGDVKSHTSPKLNAVLPYVDFIKAEENELDLLLRDLNLTLKKLIDIYKIKECVVTCGANGGYIVNSNLKTKFDAYPVYEVYDTTGAGDVFFAAFLAARLLKKKSIKDSCAFAAFLAAEHISGKFIPFEALVINQLKKGIV